MNVTAVLESGIYVDDVPRSAEFYRRVFGFQQLEGDDRFCALSVAGRQVFLIFKKGGSLHPMPMPGGMLPPMICPRGSGDWLKMAFRSKATSHGRAEAGAFIFAIPTAILENW